LARQRVWIGYAFSKAERPHNVQFTDLCTGDGSSEAKGVNHIAPAHALQKLRARTRGRLISLGLSMLCCSIQKRHQRVATSGSPVWVQAELPQMAAPPAARRHRQRCLRCSMHCAHGNARRASCCRVLRCRSAREHVAGCRTLRCSSSRRRHTGVTGGRLKLHAVDILPVASHLSWLLCRCARTRSAPGVSGQGILRQGVSRTPRSESAGGLVSRKAKAGHRGQNSMTPFGLLFDVSFRIAAFIGQRTDDRQHKVTSVQREGQVSTKQSFNLASYN
jgi:hypothetical protein